LLQSPQNFGYPAQGWNRDLLLDYIKRTYGVSYHPQHIYWIIRRLGFRSLVPRPHNYAADEEEVEEWKKM
jgi:transposase